MTREVPEDLLTREFFLTKKGNCATRLSTGVIVELPTNGETNPEEWWTATIEYVAAALLALESNPTFEVMSEYNDCRVEFPIAQGWLGWGAEKTDKESGEKIFTLYGSYH